MSKLLNLSLLVILFSSCAVQQTNFQPIERVEVIESTGDNADVLFSRAKAFIALEFVNANNVIQLADRDAHKLIAKGAMEYIPSLMIGMNYRGWIRFTLIIDTKDGKYRYQMMDFRHEANNEVWSMGRLDRPYAPKGTIRAYADINKFALGNILSMRHDLLDYMVNAPRDENW